MTAVLLLLVVVLVLVNGFFVAAEFAIVRSRPSRIQQRANEGDRRAARAQNQLDRVDEYVATCQVGITLASIGLGFAGEPAIADLIEPLLGDILGGGGTHALAFVIAYATVTLLHVIFGEQAPKMLGIARAESVLLWISGPLAIFRRLFAALIAITNVPANWVVRRVFRVDPTDVEETSPEELRLLISRGARGGNLDPGEAVMLGGVFHLHEQQAREVMTPIPAVVTINSDERAEDALQRCVSSGHTRLVAIEDDNPDRVRGVVHNNSLVRLYMNAEEVVGEIEDETDARASTVRRLADGDWYVRGHVALGDLEDAGISLPVDSDAYNSIGGYVFSELGRLPKRGDRIRAGGHEIRVESVRENRIVAVRIRPLTAEHPVVPAPDGDDG
jgi:CBS domain containing-hemolysin-like protein